MRRAELPSQGVLPGAIQVPPDGQPIILGWDGPVTGGYPVIAGGDRGGLAASWRNCSRATRCGLRRSNVEAAQALAAAQLGQSRNWDDRTECRHRRRLRRRQPDAVSGTGVDRLRRPHRRRRQHDAPRCGWRPNMAWRWARTRAIPTARNSGGARWRRRPMRLRLGDAANRGAGRAGGTAGAAAGARQAARRAVQRGGARCRRGAGDRAGGGGARSGADRWWAWPVRS